jgi:hypothetical protein
MSCWLCELAPQVYVFDGVHVLAPGVVPGWVSSHGWGAGYLGYRFQADSGVLVLRFVALLVRQG